MSVLPIPISRKKNCRLELNVLPSNQTGLATVGSIMLSTFRTLLHLGSFITFRPSTNASFWQVGLLDDALSEYPDTSHNFTNEHLNLTIFHFLLFLRIYN